MRLGDLLVAAKLVTPEQIDEALALQVTDGRRLGEILVAGGALTQAALERFLHRVPREPGSIADTRIDEQTLIGLMLKLIHVGRHETIPAIAEAIKLPHHVVAELVMMASQRRLIRTLGERGKLMAYVLTEEGSRQAQDAMSQCQYTGPAPVALDDFVALIELQKIHNVKVTFAKIRAAFGVLEIADAFIEKLGPALNSDRAMLLYGPPGNGKTSITRSFASIFDDLIYVPYAVMVGGQIMRVYDPSVHVSPPQQAETAVPASTSIFRAEKADARWVPCLRPFVVTGGELTLDMLDLKYSSVANFYEAPLHVKAMGGCFVIDDFGRQLVAPTVLLNRWIVPMENKVDFLTLHTGKTFTLPFEALLVFSTNLEPEDLMDAAFLRRLPYKLEVGAPSRDSFRRIFDRVSRQQGMTMSDEAFDEIVHRITEIKQLELAAYMPKFIVDQLVAACRFLDLPPRFESRFIEYAVDNLRVHRSKAA